MERAPIKLRPIRRDILPQNEDIIEDKDIIEDVIPRKVQPVRRAVSTLKETREEPEPRRYKQPAYDWKPKSRTKLTTIGIAVCLIVLLGSLISLAMQNGQLADKLNNTQWDLSLTERNLNSTSAELGNVSNNFNITSAKLSENNTNLNSTLLLLNTTQLKLASASHTIDDKMKLISNLSSQLDMARLGTKYTLHDPTYDEMNSFLGNDSTSNNTYQNLNYTCGYFARDVVNNATGKGIRCAFVLLLFNNTKYCHAMVAFNTSDNGLIYVEPQNDKTINITIGGKYIDIYPNVYVTDILTIW